MNLDLKVPTETHFFMLEPQYKNMWVQVCGRATPCSIKTMYDEKPLNVGLLESEDEYE